MKTNLFLKYLITQRSVFLQNDNSVHKHVYNLNFDWSITTNNMLSYDLVFNLAKMSQNAYYQPGDNNWIDPITNRTTDVRHSNETIHAYLFSNLEETVNILSFKGTSLGISGDISKNDRFNDNLFYSCCYYEQSSLFDKRDCECSLNKTICDSPDAPNIPDTSKKCYSKCYSNSTNYEMNYLKLADQILERVHKLLSAEHPTIIVTGHSLGGTLATYIGLKYDYLTVTFQSPGEKHYIELSQLKYNQNAINKIYHFGHNADTIFTGKCNGILSWCYIAGYIIETKCHIGNVCEYDAIGKLGIRESITTHPLRYVIDNVISQWKDDNGTTILPECTLSTDCIECENWNYIN